jgi:hypothetical protein
MRNITVLLFKQEILNLQYLSVYCEVVLWKCMNLKALSAEASYLEVDTLFSSGSGDLKPVLVCCWQPQKQPSSLVPKVWEVFTLGL